MTAELDQGVRASRMRVPRSRGALSGIVLVVLGAWAALVPFIGPYFHFAFTPAPTDVWHWTASRGWLSLLPGAAAFAAGLLLLVGTNRVVLSFASWLGVAAGAWLVVGPVLAPRISLNPGTPVGTSGWVQTLEQLFVYTALGAAILFFAATALGRTSVHSVRDVKAAQRRAEAAAAAREAEERRLADERAARDRAEGDAREREWAQQREQAAAAGRAGNGRTGYPTTPEQGAAAAPAAAGTDDSVARHERSADEPPAFMPRQQPVQPEQPTSEYPTTR